jgi:YesN/AraC family two-component response regulator
MDRIKVVIADDEPFVRAALREYLSADPEFHVVGEAADGDDALRLVAYTEPDVLLLDISMPRVNGLEVLQRIRNLAPATRVVVLSAYPVEDLQAAQAWNAAGAYLDKAAGAEQILRTLRRVAGASPETRAAA